MAAAAVLSETTLVGDRLQAARDRAQEIVEANPVLGRKVTIEPDVDVVFGRANYSWELNEYAFAPVVALPDAVRVTVRQTGASPTGRCRWFSRACSGGT